MTTNAKTKYSRRMVAAINEFNRRESDAEFIEEFLGELADRSDNAFEWSEPADKDPIIVDMLIGLMHLIDMQELSSIETLVRYAREEYGRHGKMAS